MNVKTRIAPSPTGDPHVGTAYVALVNYCFAKKNGGEFVLRIEDTDRVRSTLESEAAILRSLRWLGFGWSGAPVRQSERSEVYRLRVEELLEAGHAFRCFCTAERLEEMRVAQRAAGRPPRYDGHCLTLTKGEIEANVRCGVKAVIRMRVPEEGRSIFQDLLRGRIEIEWKDVDMQVLMKSDGFPTYHLANVVDDHDMRITHVIRGEEWISSAPKHLLLYQYFGWSAPQLCHLPLLRNPDKSKLSKRKNPTSILYYRERGYLPQALLHFLGMLIDSRNDDPGLLALDTCELLDAMCAHFELDRVSLGGPVFDLDKLTWLNGQHLRSTRLSDAQFLETLSDFGYAWPPAIPTVHRERIAQIARPRIATLADFEPLVAFFSQRPQLEKSDLESNKFVNGTAKRALEAASERLISLDETGWRQMEIGRRLQDAVTECRWRFRDVARLYYVAITGSPTSVPLFDAMELLGKTESLRRLRIALEVLG
ncbi:MAG: glutamate--tRNA ligase [Candidatus Eremiobacteraeota bacterium]|nr:glutamate--tRNA ligase [Candidatus Eremiobacteraeota bacterium]